MRKHLIVSVLAGLAVWGQIGVQMARADTPAEQAKQLFDDGRKAFRLGNFDEAIAKWTEAYKLKDDPVYLFNIGQAYRQKGDLEQAVRFLRNYLHEAPANIPNRAQVEARIAEIDALITARRGEKDKPPTGPADPAHPEQNPERTPTVPPIEDQPPHSGKTMKIAGIATGGVGVVLVVTGLVFGAKVSSAQDEINAAAAAHQPWTPELQATDDSGRSAATIAPICLGLGAAAIVTGGVLFYLGVRADRSGSERPRTEASIVPTPGGMGIVVRGSF